MSLQARRMMWRAGRKLYMYARKEAPNEMASNGELRLQRLMVGTLQPGAKLTAFDIGARIGDWSKALVNVASDRQGGIALHAFEPVPESRAMLEAALVKQIERGEVRVNSIAISDESKSTQIYVPHFTGGTSTLHPDSSVEYERLIDVSTSTVDRYCAENAIEHVDLIKIDTEGNDFRVIRGARDMLLRGSVGVVQFEYNYRWIHSRSYLKDVFDQVEKTQYCVAKVCPDSLEVYVSWHPELERFFETNYALVHRKLLGPLGCTTFRIGAGNVCESVGTEARYPSIGSENASA
jgi:FkbM family methyltransferase